MITWIYSHVQHLVSYPAVIWLARKFGQYEINKLRRTTMQNIEQIKAEIAIVERLMPVVENFVAGLGPTTALVGADAGVIVNDAVKLVGDIKGKMTALKAVVEAAAQNAPAI